MGVFRWEKYTYTIPTKWRNPNINKSFTIYTTPSYIYILFAI